LQVRAKRREADPNLGFLCALGDWAETCRAAEAAELADTTPPHAAIPLLERARTGPLLVQPPRRGDAGDGPPLAGSDGPLLRRPRAASAVGTACGVPLGLAGSSAAGHFSMADWGPPLVIATQSF